MVGALSISDQIAASLAGAAAHRRATGRPFVTLSYAQSLDGCIAARGGRRLALSGPEALRLTHELRAGHDAILVGIGTVLADNPRLTVRLAPGDHPQPVVVDSRLRFPLDALLLQHPGGAPWIAAAGAPDPTRRSALEAAGARVHCLPPTPEGWVDLPALLDRLGELGVASLMVEGGARVITSFLTGGLVDQLIVTIAPRLVGGRRAVGRLGPPGTAGRPRLVNVSYHHAGADLILRADVRRDEP